MEEHQQMQGGGNQSSNQASGDKRGSNFWLWVVIVVIVLVALFWVFKKPSSGDVMEKPTPTPVQPTPTPETDGISALDVGDNPDLGVEDFNTLPTSQEPVN